MNCAGASLVQMFGLLCSILVNLSQNKDLNFLEAAVKWQLLHVIFGFTAVSGVTECIVISFREVSERLRACVGVRARP